MPPTFPKTRKTHVRLEEQQPYRSIPQSDGYRRLTSPSPHWEAEDRQNTSIRNRPTAHQPPCSAYRFPDGIEAPLRSAVRRTSLHATARLQRRGEHPTTTSKAVLTHRGHGRAVAARRQPRQTSAAQTAPHRKFRKDARRFECHRRCRPPRRYGKRNRRETMAVSPHLSAALPRAIRLPFASNPIAHRFFRTVSRCR